MSPSSRKLNAAVLIAAVGRAASAGEACEAVSHAGFLVDNWCWDMDDHIGFDTSNLETSPQDHKVGCLQLTQDAGGVPCVENGYALLSLKDGGNYTRTYKLDATSNERALAMIKKTELKNDYFVKIEGEACPSENMTEHVLTIADGDGSYVECEAFEHTGYLVDNWCWDQPDHIGFDKSNLELEPWKHKVGCLKLTENAETGTPPCVEGGYALLKEKDDGTFERAVMLDAASNERALKVIESSAKTDNFAVKATGYLCGTNGNVTLHSIEEVDLSSPTAARSAAFGLVQTHHVIFSLVSMMAVLLCGHM